MLGTLLDLGNPVSDHPLNQGLVAWWLGLPNNKGGSRLFDIKGGNHGTLTNGPTWGADPGGFGAVRFDGSTQYGRLASFDLSPYVAVTVSAWVRASAWPTAGNYAMLWELTADGNSNTGGLTFYADGSFGLTYGMRGDVGINGRYTSAGLPATNTWLHLAVTYNFAAGDPEGAIYINGLPQPLGTPAGASSDNSASSRFANSAFNVGNRNAGSLLFNGSVADLRVTGRALSAEAWALYEQSRRGHPDTLRRVSSRVWSFGAGGPSEIIGSASVTLGACTASGTGTLALAGTASVTLGAATATAAGELAITGSASQTLGTATTTAAGALALTGSAAIDLGAATQSAAGALALAGSADVTLGAAALSASGALALSGAADVTLGSASLGASGSLNLAGSAGIDLDPAAVSATGGSQATGDADITLGAATQTATGAVALSGTAGVTLGPATVSGTGSLSLSGALAAALGAVTSAATGALSLVGALARTLGSAVLSAAGYSGDRGGRVVSLAARDRSAVSLPAADASTVALPARDRSVVSLTARAED